MSPDPQTTNPKYFKGEYLRAVCMIHDSCPPNNESYLFEVRTWLLPHAPLTGDIESSNCTCKKSLPLREVLFSFGLWGRNPSSQGILKSEIATASKFEKMKIPLPLRKSLCSFVLWGRNGVCWSLSACSSSRMFVSPQTMYSLDVS